MNIWFFSHQKHEIWKIGAEKLKSIGNLKVEQLVAWRNERLVDAQILTESPFFSQGMKNFLTNTLNKEYTTHIFTRLNSLIIHSGYENILLVDTDGKKFLSVGKETSITLEHLQLLKTTFKERKPIFSELYIEPHTTISYISIIAPIFANDLIASPIGAVILVINANKFLYRLINYWPIPSQTAETLFVQRDGNNVLYFNKLRHDQTTISKIFMPLHHTEKPAITNVLGLTGIFEGVDYRGIKVLAYISSISDSSWFIISKQDLTEIFASWYVHTFLLMSLFTAVGIIFITIILFLWQRYREKHYHNLYLKEIELNSINQRHSVILQSINDAIITSDSAGNIVGWNNSASKLFNYTEIEILHQSLTKIIPESFKLQHSFGMERLKHGAKPHILGKTIEVNGLRKDGTQFPIELSLTKWEVKGSIFFSGIIRDLTERKADEIARNKLQEELLQAQKMESIGKLAGGVAHDFNNVLGVILGNAELALNKITIDNPLRTKLERIRSAVLQSAGITKQLLSFARRHPSSPQVLDLNTALPEMLHMLRQLIGEDINLIWQLSENLWPIKIDPTQLNQLLANLCINARDAIAGIGNIIIATSKIIIDSNTSIEHSNLVSGEFVLLSVTDNGCGMDAQIKAKIFEPFFTTKPPGKGTGLGLSTVFGIVKQHHGFIGVDSQVGKGSSFRVYFPRCIEQIQLLSFHDEALVPAKHGTTVLLVEDEAELLDIIKTILENNGYLVLTAISPIIAKQLMQNYDGKIELLITDVVMPEMSGLELAKQLTQSYPQLKVLFMSGYTDEDTMQRYAFDTKDNLIRKPFTNIDFINKVHKTLVC